MTIKPVTDKPSVNDEGEKVELNLSDIFHIFSILLDLKILFALPSPSAECQGTRISNLVKSATQKVSNQVHLNAFTSTSADA